jgi:FKBP-type peptidyl-prolyl cis-trans isomerase
MPITATTENVDLGLDTDKPATRTWVVPDMASTQAVVVGSYGVPDAAAENGDIVALEYIGRLADTGKIFDSSLQHHPADPLVIVLGNGQVIKGWELGIVGMHVGEMRKLTIPPELAYGKTGSKDGTIPPNAKLEFMVKLVGLRKAN